MVEPTQDRSRKSLDRMLLALEELLKERSFDKVTIADLAAHAGVAVGSIYARFADKQALLLGMHKRIHERSGDCRADMVDPIKWKDRSLNVAIRSGLRVSIRYYRQHGDVLRAVASNAPPEAIAMVTEEIEEFKEGMVQLIAAKRPVENVSILRDAVDAIVRTVIAVLYFRAVQTRIPTFKPISEARLLDELFTIVQALLQPALQAPSMTSHSIGSD